MPPDLAPLAAAWEPLPKPPREDLVALVEAAAHHKQNT
jgi:hypothetical protein